MRCQWKDNCKLTLTVALVYVTELQSLVKFTTIEHGIQMHTYIKLQVTNVAVCVDKHLSEP